MGKAVIFLLPCLKDNVKPCFISSSCLQERQVVPCKNVCFTQDVKDPTESLGECNPQVLFHSAGTQMPNSK